MISFFKQTISGLSKTRNKLSNLFAGFSGKSILNESDLEQLEEALLAADIGWKLTENIIETLKEPDKEQQKLMLYSSLFSRSLWSMTYSNVSQGQCFECMRVCPVGNKHRLKK